MTTSINTNNLVIIGPEPDIESIVIDGTVYDMADYNGDSVDAIGDNITVSGNDVFSRSGFKTPALYDITLK